MKITRDQASNVTIRRIESGGVMVGDQLQSENFALTTVEVISNWQTPPIEDLTEKDFEPLIASQPEMILLGTGSKPVFPPRELVFSLARQGIGLEAMDTGAACRTFNILIGEGRSVAAVMIVND